MSYFDCDVIWIIVPTADITNEMVNNMKLGFSTTDDTMRKSNDGTLTLMKVKSPVSPVFNGYKWYNEKDIRAELAKPEWVPSV